MLDALVHQEVRGLARLGMTDTEIARRTGVARSTVRDICKPRPRPEVVCPRCWVPAKALCFSDDERYAYLLGLYLGDGSIARLARTFSFRLSLDAKYPGIVAEARTAMASCSPTGRVSQHL
ncbi:MAG: hypothetical protein QOF76_4870, partial [Solirubrobacteraceae bacterium]|nr:hypothetical protein [Solirubrobacteraceae bacterium]